MAPKALPFFRMAPTAPPFFSVSARFRKTRRYTNVVCCGVLSARIGKTGRYTNGLLPREDPAFGAKPRPECSANFFLGRTHSFNLSFSFPRFVAWPLELGLGTHNPRFGVAPRVGVRDSQSTLCCVAPQVGVRDSQSTVFESEATTSGAERSRPLKSVGKRNKKRRDEAQRELQSKRARPDSSSSSSEGELFKDL